MSEQRVTRKKQNIIRFPMSPRERRRILQQAKDPRVRLTGMLRTVCGWLLFAGTLLFLLTNYQLFSPTSIRSLAEYAAAGLQQLEGDITTINYENGFFSDGALFQSGLAYVDDDTLYLARPGSVTTLQYELGYSSPAVETADDYVLVYDRGGTRAALLNSIAPTAELSLSSPILTGCLGPNGRFALVTDEQGYRTAAAVYTADGSEVFKYQSSEYYIVSVALSPDGSTIAVLAFQQNGASLRSHVLFYNISNGELQADAVLSGVLGIELCYPERDTVAVLCDDGLHRVTSDGETERMLMVSSADLIAITVQNDSMALATRSYSGDARCDLYILRDGHLSAPRGLDEEPSALAVSASGAAVLSASGASVYDTDLTPLWHNTDAIGARRLLLTDNGTVFALYSKHARLFTTHSERSEEISDAE
nr:DUF5711 family protein [uncultured Agathobaculum sp.]